MQATKHLGFGFGSCSQIQRASHPHHSIITAVWSSSRCWTATAARSFFPQDLAAACGPPDLGIPPDKGSTLSNQIVFYLGCKG